MEKTNVRTATMARDVPSVPGSTSPSNLTRDATAAFTTASIAVRPSQKSEIRTSTLIGRIAEG